MSERIAPATYKARGIEGTAQHGHSKNGHEQISVDLMVPSLNRVLTTFLFFSDDAAPFSLDRLHALGWEGGDDPALPGISRNEVDVSIRYETFQGEEKLKVEIVTGGGRVTMKNTMTEQQKRGFMSRLATLDKRAGLPVTATADAAPARKMAL